MTNINTQANILSDMVADYRVPPTPAHVIKWVEQFDAAVRLPLLKELTHVLGSTYFTLENVRSFFASLSTNKKISGDNPLDFWSSVNFLNIQGGGGSQREMLGLFSAILKSEFGLNTSETGQGSSTYAYIDDAMFTGGRIRSDLIKWVENDAPDSANLHVIVIAMHEGGHYFANSKINAAIRASGKKIKITWWRAVMLEDRKSYTNGSDVLRPIECPDDDLVKNYVNSLRFPVKWRTPGNVGAMKLFSSDEGRQLLEFEFLKAGAKIRYMCPHLNQYQRPLGNMVLEALGFGSLIVTFRNCPNNAPLALWAGDPWIPLFPRTTNSDNAVREFMKNLKI